MAPVGKTEDVGWNIGASRTYPVDPAEAWEVVTGPGLPLWFGAEQLPAARGEPYELADGTVGELRSHRPGDRVRLTWRPAGWDHDTTLQVTVSGGPGKAVVRFHQEWLADAEERERQRSHWKAALDRLDPLLGRA